MNLMLLLIAMLFAAIAVTADASPVIRGRSTLSTQNIAYAKETMWLCKEVYNDNPTSNYGYQIEATASQGEAFAGIYTKDNVCYVVFRGSNNLNDWAYNLGSLRSKGKQIGKYTLANAFWEHYVQIENQVLAAINNLKAAGKCSSVRAAGHSLGGASAVIFHASGYASKSITFSAPETFISGCDDDFRKDAQRFYASVWGMVDIVPSLPFMGHCAGINYQLSKSYSWGTKYSLTARTEKEPNAGISIDAHMQRNVFEILDRLDGNGIEGISAAEANFQMVQERYMEDNQGKEVTESYWKGIAMGCGGFVVVAAAALVVQKLRKPANTATIPTRGSRTYSENPAFVPKGRSGRSPSTVSLKHGSIDESAL